MNDQGEQPKKGKGKTKELAPRTYPAALAFAQHVKKAADRAGGGSAFARELGEPFDSKAISRIITRTTDPQLDRIQRIADALGKPVWEMLIPEVADKSASRAYIERSLIAAIQSELSDDELIGLNDAVNAAIVAKRSRVNTGDAPDSKRIYFNLDRRNHSVEVADDRRGKYDWTVSDPSGNPTQGPGAQPLKAVKRVARSSK